MFWDSSLELGLWYQPTCIFCDALTHRKLDLCFSCENDFPRLQNCCVLCAEPLPVRQKTCGSCLGEVLAEVKTTALFAYQSPLDHLVIRFCL